MFSQVVFLELDIKLSLRDIDNDDRKYFLSEHTRLAVDIRATLWDQNVKAKTSDKLTLVRWSTMKNWEI